MSREIKFRAWDRLNKKIVTSGLSINLDTTDRVIPISFSQGDLSYCRDNGVSSVPNAHTDIEIMQYTGLKDRQGVEIYEGDIVDCERHGFTTSIEYYGGAFRCRSEGVPLSLYIDECYADKDDNNQLEVIGNIYENGHLLENESKEAEL